MRCSQVTTLRLERNFTPRPRLFRSHGVSSAGGHLKPPSDDERSVRESSSGTLSRATSPQSPVPSPESRVPSPQSPASSPHIINVYPMHVTAIIAAGGRGQRFGGAQPKVLVA